MTDSFSPKTRVATTVPKTQVVLTTIKGTPNTYEDTFSFDILDADGEHFGTRHGNLMAHAQGWTLTAGQKAAIGACNNVAQLLVLLQDYLQTKAEGAVG